MRSLVNLLLRLARCSSGSAWIEAFFTVPLAILLMVGVVDFGMAFQTWGTGNKSVRDAARYLGSLTPPGPAGSGTACTDAAISNAKNLAVYGNISGSGSPLVPGWQVNGGSNNQVNVDCSTPGVIVVTASFPYNTLMPSVTLAPFGRVLLPGTITLSARHKELIVGV